jgi:cobalamin biosynthesis protein CbiG
MKTLHVGIGCRLHSSADQIDAAVRAALGANLAFDAIAAVATIDAKAGEPGLREFCERHALPLRVFSRQQIAGAPRTPAAASEKVLAHLGVDGVCEPCALLAAQGGHLIVGKTTQNGVAVAIASTIA